MDIQHGEHFSWRIKVINKFRTEIEIVAHKKYKDYFYLSLACDGHYIFDGTPNFDGAKKVAIGATYKIGNGYCIEWTFPTDAEKDDPIEDVEGSIHFCSEGAMEEFSFIMKTFASLGKENKDESS